MKTIEEGIILKRISYSETSQIVTVLTRSKGLKTYLYKGGKKKKTALFPLLICEFGAFQRNESQLAVMSECTSNSKTAQLVENPIKALIAFFTADVILNCLPSEEEDEQLYAFVTSWIKVLAISENTTLFPTLFLAQLITQIGYSPDIISSEAKSFDIKNGEFLSYEKQDSYCVYGEECKNLFLLFKNEDFDVRYRQRILKILIDFCTIHIPKFDVSKSLDIITTVLHD